MNARRFPLIIGLVLALGTGLLLLNYLTQVRDAGTKALKHVVVATKDIPARAVITADELTTEDRTAAPNDTDSIELTSDAIGKMSLITIPAGSDVSRSKIGEPTQYDLPTKLTGGLRAVSISIDKVKGVSGFLQAGDRVDVIAVSPASGDAPPKATTILRGALVLAIGNETQVAHAAPSSTQNSTTITLALTPQQANLIALADVNTTLRLALRSPNEPIRAYPAEPLQLGESVRAPAPSQPAVAVASAPSAPPTPSPTARPTPGVTVIDGDVSKVSQ